MSRRNALYLFEEIAPLDSEVHLILTNDSRFSHIGEQSWKKF